MKSKTLSFLFLTAIALGAGCGDDGDDAAGGSGGSGGSGGTPRTFDAYPANLCVGEKQAAAGAFCEAALDAWASFQTVRDETTREETIGRAEETLVEAWSAAEASAAESSANCSDLAQGADEVSAQIGAEVANLATRYVDTDADPSSEDATCAAALLGSAGDLCAALLDAESVHLRSLDEDPEGATLAEARTTALDAFETAFADSTGSDCALEVISDEISEPIVDLAGSVVRDTVVAPGLDDSQYTTLSPGPTDYLGRTYTPQCVQGSEYRYFARRGSENKLLIYYQGGGACWNGLTCGIPTCRAQPNDNLDEFAAEGFFDLSDERNPFRNWNVVFVTYCSCDIHFGDASVTYDEDEEPTQHLGFHNAKVVEKWAREHFLNPEVVFVTGSSAGAYGAWFHGPLLHDVWPASQMHILADAGNGVITEDFLENEFSVWNFVPNLADVPGTVEAITEGGGMPAYSEAVATAFPNTNWAHYTAFYDGSPGGQSGFYNVMLNDGSPAGTALWWEAVCEFGDLALQQSEQTFAAVPENYRYYFGSGTEHTVFRFPKVYTDTAGGVPLLVDWVTAMLNSGPDDKDPAWANVLCEDCGVLLESDPRPAPLQPPFIEDGPITEVVCD